MKIQFAENCGWRALYVSVRNRDNTGYQWDEQLLAVILDPWDGNKPELKLLLPGNSYFRQREVPGCDEVRIPLPTVRWKHPCNLLRSLAYQFVRRFWHNIDGRYGWGTKTGGLPMFRGYYWGKGHRWTKTA